MLNLLRGEFFKLRKSKAFYICMVVGCLLMAVTAFSLQLSSKMLTSSPELAGQLTQQMQQFDTGDEAKLGTGTNDFDQMLSPTMEKLLQTCLSDNSVQVVLAVFISIFIASEFHSGTIKNLCCRGQSRVKIYLSKLITVSVGGIVMSLAAVLTAAVLGGALWGFTVSSGFWLHLLRMLALELYLTVAISGMFTGIAMAVRSTGGAIALNLCLIIFATAVFMICNLIMGGDTSIADYWIISNFSAVNSFAVKAEAIWRALGVGAAYFAVFTGLGMVSLQKRDV